MCKLRLAVADPAVRWRLRSALKEDARGAAIVLRSMLRYSVEGMVWMRTGVLMDGMEDVVVDVVLRGVHVQGRSMG